MFSWENHLKQFSVILQVCNFWCFIFARSLLGKIEKRNSELGEISILIHSIEMVSEITHIYTPGKAKQGKRIN